MSNLLKLASVVIVHIFLVVRSNLLFYSSFVKLLFEIGRFLFHNFLSQKVSLNLIDNNSIND
jgi:hypothetical protein